MLDSFSSICQRDSWIEVSDVVLTSVAEMNETTTNTSELEKRPELSKHGNFYKDSLCMCRSVHATYPNILATN